MSSIIEKPNFYSKLSIFAINRLTIEDWQILVSESETAFELVTIFLYAQKSILLPEIHNFFFERIHYLKNTTKSSSELNALWALGQEVESIVQKEYSDEAPLWLRNVLGGGKDGLQ